MNPENSERGGICIMYVHSKITYTSIQRGRVQLKGLVLLGKIA